MIAAEAAGRPMSLADAQIAGICLAGGHRLATERPRLRGHHRPDGHQSRSALRLVEVNRRNLPQNCMESVVLWSGSPAKQAGAVATSRGEPCSEVVEPVEAATYGQLTSVPSRLCRRQGWV